MDDLQVELRETYPLLKIQIVGINEFGQDPPGANDLMVADTTTPWLQDGDSNGNFVSDLWYESWNVTYRDVIILDGQNEMIDVYNLTPPTGFDLGVPANYATLRDKLLDAAMAEQKPWQNPRDRFDTNDDGFVVPGDVLIMINEINANGPLELPPPTGTVLAAPFWDTNGDNFFSPVDILQVINFIEDANAEGEGAGDPQWTMLVVPEEVVFAPTAATNLGVSGVVDVALQEAPAASPAKQPALLEPARLAAVPAIEAVEADDFWADYWPAD